MGGTLHAVVYVRRSIKLSVRRQVAACLAVAEEHGMDIVALVAYDGAHPADAIRCIESGEAEVLLVAHPDVLGPARVRKAITQEVERAGGELCFASVMRADPDPLMDLAARMARQGLRAEQIADVLDIDAARARDLIRRAGDALCLLVMAACAWAQDRAGRLAAGTLLVAGLVVGESAWHYPETSPAPPPMEQRTAPAGRTITAPAPSTPAKRRPRTPQTRTTTVPPPAAPSPSASPSGSPSPTTPGLPLPSCVDLASPLACTQGLLPST